MLRAHCTAQFGGQCVETHAEKDDHFAQKKNLKIKCSWGGSNSRPSDYETDALPTELQKHIICWCTGIKQGITSGIPKSKACVY